MVGNFVRMCPWACQEQEYTIWALALKNPGFYIKDFSQNCQSVINPPPISHLVYNNRLVLLASVFLCTKLAQLILHCFPFDIKMFMCLCTLINALEWILNMCLCRNGSTRHRVFIFHVYYLMQSSLGVLCLMGRLWSCCYDHHTLPGVTVWALI